MIRENQPDDAEIRYRLGDTTAMTAALKQAARQAIEQHAQARQKIAIWRGGQVVWEDALPDQPRSTTE